MKKFTFLMIFALSFAVISINQTIAQTQMLAGGNMELASDWMITDLNSPVSATAVWNYTANAPAFGKGGNLYISSVGDGNSRQYCIYQPLNLSKDKAYDFDAAIKDLTGVVNDSWVEVFLGTKPTDGQDYGSGQKLIAKFSTWDACTHKNVDGTFKINGCHNGIISLDTTGLYYFVFKIGTFGNSSFNVLVDEMSFVEITSKPLTAFSANVTKGYAPLTVNFTDQSSFAESWAWDLGDGTTSTEKNPSHTYATKGIYTVSLKATNSNGDSTLTKTDYITVKEVPNIPVDGVIMGGNMEDATKWQISYLNTAEGNEPTATWNYTSQTPGAGRGGNLYVSGDVNNFQTQYCIYQEVNLSNNRIYTFNGAVRDISENLTNSWIEVFIGTKPVDGEDYGSGQWRLANFSTWDACTAKNVDGTFDMDGCYGGSIIPDTAGTYYFVLKVGIIDWESTNRAFDILIDELSFVESTSKPFPAFSADNLTGFAPFTMNFINDSKLADSYSWNFGDGTTSTEENPEHTYAAVGKYTVSLTATNAQGDSTKTKVDYITVNEQTSLPNGEKLYGGNMENPDFWVITNLNATSIPVATWNYTESSPAGGVGGNLRVKATVNNQTSHYCIWQAVTLKADSVYVFDGLFKDISGVDHFWCEVFIGDVAPVDGADYNADPEGIEKISYFNTWEGKGKDVDGTFSENAFNPMNPFQPTADGTYYFVLKLGNTDWENKDYSFEVLLDELSLKETTPVVLPTAAFFADVTTGDAPLTVQFYNQSENAINYVWYFGDGATSTEKEPSHTYTSGGSYTVSLVAKSENAQDSLAKTDLIVITGTDINENTQMSYSVYPNPTSGSFNIDFDKALNSKLTILNIVGETVMIKSDLQKSNTISTGNLNKGIYFIQVELEGKTCTQKLIVN